MRTFNPRTAMKNWWYLDKYHACFSGIQDQPLTILELGILGGDSVAMFADYFPNSRIMALDFDAGVVNSISERLESGDLKKDNQRINIYQGDQADPKVLEMMIRHAGHFDIIIDDAAHQGAKARASYDALFPHLRSQGYYVIEDWGTGYWPEWPDGSQPTNMVALIKDLVDEAGYPDTRREPKRPSLYEWMTVSYGQCIIKKA